MKELNVVTFIARNCADYADFLHRSMETFKSDDVQINYFYVESNGGDERSPEDWICIGETPGTGHNSGNHGLALNYAYEFAQKYEGDADWVFVDADIAITYQDWDKYLTSALDTVSCTGFAYGTDGPRYQNFPCVFFIAFNKDFLKAKINWKPALSKYQDSPLRQKVGENEAEVFDLPVGAQIKCDTGWRVPKDAKQHIKAWSYIPRVLGGETNSLLPFRDKKMRNKCLSKPEHMAEWHLEGELFGTHKQASRSMAFDSKWGKIWRWRINQYCVREHGKELK